MRRRQGLNAGARLLRAERTASIKAPRQSKLGVFTEQKKCQCDWTVMKEGAEALTLVGMGSTSARE